jgi:lipopolysaccharide exporter
MSCNQNIPQSLSEQVVRSSLWSFGLQLFSRGMGLARTMILARLLAPAEFGIIGAAMLVISGLDVLSQTGVNPYLVQRRGCTENHLNTAWTLSILRGLGLAVLTIAASSVAAEMLNSAQSAPVLQIVALSGLFLSFGNVGIISFQKDLRFDRQFLYESIPAALDLAVSVILAFHLGNVWALVWGGMAGNAARFILSYVLHPYRPRFVFNRSCAGEITRYGKWIWSAGILMFLVTQGDGLVVVKMLGVSALGLYQIAFLIANLPATEITNSLYQVALPTYAKLQDHIEGLRKAFLGILRLTLFIAIPMAFGIAVLAVDITRIVLGERWVTMAPAMMILTAASVVRLIPATARPLYQGIGKPQIDTRLQFASLAVLALSICPLTGSYGIEGTAFAVLLSVIPRAAGYLHGCARILEIRVKQLAGIILIPVLNAALMTILVAATRHAMPSVGSWQLGALILEGMAGYALLACLAERYFHYGMLALIEAYIPWRVPGVSAFRGWILKPTRPGISR